MKYLVCRVDATEPGARLRSSDHFPCIVDVKPGASYMDIMSAVFNEQFSPKMGNEYYIVHMDNVAKVKVTPNPTFTLERIYEYA